MICHGYIIIKIVIEIYARTVIILILFYCETFNLHSDITCFIYIPDITCFIYIPDVTCFLYIPDITCFIYILMSTCYIYIPDVTRFIKHS